MEHATGVLGGLSLWAIVVLAIVAIAIGGGIAWAVIAARKGAKGMGRLEKRLDHRQKKKKRKRPTPARRQ